MGVIQTEDLLLVGSVAVLHGFQMAMTAKDIGALRRKYKIAPPTTDGPPEFIRAMRAQQNCLEFGVPFQIVMWSAGLFCHQVPAAALGLIYVVARQRYIKGYTEAAEKRMPGFIWSVRAMKGLLFVCAVGLGNSLLNVYLGIDVQRSLLNAYYGK